eukprot:g2144.t1
MDPLNALFHFSLFFSSFALFIAFIQKTSIHHIPEGCVGVYYRRGKLLEKTTDPGLRARVPCLDSYVVVLIRSQQNEIKNISCRTREGIEVEFQNIMISYKLDREHVVNLLREFGKSFRQMLIINEVNRALCEVMSNHTVDSVVQTKPKEIGDATMSLLKKHAQNGIRFNRLYVIGLHFVAKPLDLELLEIAKIKLQRLKTKERELLLADEARLNKLTSLQEIELAALLGKRQMELESETQELKKQLQREQKSDQTTKNEL